MTLQYQDPEYACERLSGSIVRYGGAPVYVDHIDNEGYATIIPCGVQVPFVKHVEYQELDLTPVPLGNVNTPHGVVYASRVPKRRDWRQGLRENNLTVYGVVGFGDRLSLRGQAVTNTIMGIYPSFKESVEKVVCDEVVAVAFSRHFSVSKGEGGLTLHYREKEVGTIEISVEGTPLHKWKEEYSYLQEMFQEEVR